MQTLAQIQRDLCQYLGECGGSSQNARFNYIRSKYVVLAGHTPLLTPLIARALVRSSISSSDGDFKQILKRASVLVQTGQRAFEQLANKKVDSTVIWC